MLWDFVLLLALAGVFGAAIGIEREYRAKGAGFRTHFLVSIGSALMMIVSMYGFDTVIDGVTTRLDPSRMAGQVITEVGFIGAGTIILQKQVVRGLTTAAGIFATAGIGLAAGGGMYWLALIATGMVLFGMEIFVFTHPTSNGTSTVIAFSTAQQEDLKKISEEMIRLHFRVLSYELVEVAREKGMRYRVEMMIHPRKPKDEQTLLQYMHSFRDLLIEKIE
ncbi:MAG: MgtC/SapB family protein [Rikenellaceae bacterium]|nr:MgtC/SapB family protein [Rikenellaceae bacterium]